MDSVLCTLSAKARDRDHSWRKPTRVRARVARKLLDRKLLDRKLLDLKLHDLKLHDLKLHDLKLLDLRLLDLKLAGDLVNYRAVAQERAFETSV
jgi:hypothetical protein